MLTQSLKLIPQHVSDIKQAYDACFQQDIIFEASFIYSVHIQVQAFLNSCYDEDKDSLDVDSLDFSPLLWSIKMGTYAILKPPRVESTDIDSSANTRKNTESDANPKASKKQAQHNKAVFSRHQDLTVFLRANEKFGQLFNP